VARTYKIEIYSPSYSRNLEFADSYFLKNDI